MIMRLHFLSCSREREIAMTIEAMQQTLRMLLLRQRFLTLPLLVFTLSRSGCFANRLSKTFRTYALIRYLLMARVLPCQMELRIR